MAVVQKRGIEYVQFPLDEGVSDMFDVNPRTLRRVDVDGVCLREVAHDDPSMRLVSCAPSMFTEARHSLVTVVFFDAWFEIMPMVEVNLPSPHPRRHVLVSPGWVRDMITRLQWECPLIAPTTSAETSAIELVSSHDGRIGLRNDWCTGCN